MGFELYVTEGTARFLESNSVVITELRWPLDKKEPNTLTCIEKGKIGLVVNIPKSYEQEELRNAYLIRRRVVEFGVPIITNAELMKTFVTASHTFHNRTSLGI